MKDIHIVALLGGAAALAYCMDKKKKSDAVRQSTPESEAAAAQLEGYFPTSGYFSVGAISGPAIGPYGRGHLHKVPCCSGCAQGRGCNG